MLDEQIIERLKRAGDTSPGAINLAADIVQLCWMEAEGWTNRPDDAIRIPSMLAEAATGLRFAAQRREA